MGKAIIEQGQPQEHPWTITLLEAGAPSNWPFQFYN